MQAYKNPGVFVEEISTLAPSVVTVATAIPAFIGYTEKGPQDSIEAHRINSFQEYQTLFGGPFQETFNAEIQQDASGVYSVNTPPAEPKRPSFYLYYSLRMFYANGGGPCHIVSVGDYEATADSTTMLEGLAALDKEDEPTLILFPDALNLLPDESADINETILANYYSLFQQALLQCSTLKDRFTIIDLHRGDQDIGLLDGVIQEFRNNIGNNNLSYGSAYYPWLLSNLQYGYDELNVTISGSETDTRLIYDTSDLEKLPEVPNDADPPVNLVDDEKRLHYEARSLFHLDNAAYSKIKTQIASFRVTLPPSGAVAGVYARVDNQRGVHKAPANISLNNVIRPLVNIDDLQQEDLNEHTSGKSVNVIRSFTGKGVLIWGGRTLAGNSNEWRYISVRRFFLFVEESIKKAVENFVFEANNESSWIRLRSLIENFLTLQWKAGALVGSTPDQAYYVRIGLGETMSPQDILEGRLIVEVGMAVVRPAEFIILKFTHKLPEA